MWIWSRETTAHTALKCLNSLAPLKSFQTLTKWVTGWNCQTELSNCWCQTLRCLQKETPSSRVFMTRCRPQETARSLQIGCIRIEPTLLRTINSPKEKLTWKILKRERLGRGRIWENSIRLKLKMKKLKMSRYSLIIKRIKQILIKY